MDEQDEHERKDRRVRQMLKTYYGVSAGKLDADDDTTSVDSAAFDIDLYFSQVLKTHDLANLQEMKKQLEHGMLVASE
jgi:hypothetical protein